MKKLFIITKHFLSIFLLTILFSACQKDTSDSQDTLKEESTTQITTSLSVSEALAMAASPNGTISRVVSFGPATTNFTNTCLENIRFGGTIEEKIHRSTDAQGNVHYVRSFNAKGMTGTGLTSGKTYTVVGGNEMFSIKNPVMGPVYPNIGASINNSDVLIHQGTLVFVRSDGQRVIARHSIVVTPHGTVKNEWTCAGRKG